MNILQKEYLPDSEEDMLKVHSIFDSFSGEIGNFHQGEYVKFLRLYGCNLKCPYCDASEAVSSAKYLTYSAEELDMKLLGVKKLLITGGEPLLQQKELMNLISLLRYNDKFIKIQIETNGTIVPSRELYELVNCFVFDYKMKENQYSNIFDSDKVKWFENFTSGRKLYIKFVIGDQSDFKHMILIIKDIEVRYHLLNVKFAVSPEYGKISPLAIHSWIMDTPFLRDKIILNMQLHKLLDPTCKKIL